MSKLTVYPFRGKAIGTDHSHPDASSPSSSPPPIPLAALSTNPKLAAQAAAQADDKNIVRRKLTGYVGFANLPNQWHRKSVRKGFNFNVMVVGKFFSSLLNLIDCPCFGRLFLCTTPESGHKMSRLRASTMRYHGSNSDNYR
jgi:hypothetical protein